MGYPRPLFPISASHNLNLLKVSRLLPVKYKRKDCTPIFFIPQSYCLGETPILEHYLNSPADTDVKELLTEVWIPIVK